MKILILIVILMLSGCATTPIATKDAKRITGTSWLDRRYMGIKPDLGQVTIKRDEGYLGSGCKVIASVDGIDTAELWGAEKVILYMPPGEHIFGMSFGALCLDGGINTETMAVVKKERPLTLRIGIGPPAFITQTAK
jgi:hypothetical protein